MGLNTQKDYTYLAPSRGFLRNKSKNIVARSYTGTIISIRRTTEMYKETPDKEGIPVEKVEIKMKDNSSDDVACIKFQEASWFSAGFFARCEGFDILKPIELAASQEKKDERVTYCWIKQDGKVVPKKADKCFSPNKVTVSNKTMNDWGELLKLIPDFVKRLHEKIPVSNYATELTETAHSATPIESTGADDLPF